MFSRQLTRAGRTRSFVVTSLEAAGWEVRVEEDGAVIRRTRYSDWHRVERALLGLEREMQELIARGWQQLPEASVHSTKR